jgi:hypothetical protein
MNEWKQFIETLVEETGYVDETGMSKMFEFVTPNTHALTTGEWIFISFWTLARVIFGGAVGFIVYHFIVKYW